MLLVRVGEVQLGVGGESGRGDVREGQSGVAGERKIWWIVCDFLLVQQGELERGRADPEEEVVEAVGRSRGSGGMQVSRGCRVVRERSSRVRLTRRWTEERLHALDSSTKARATSQASTGGLPSPFSALRDPPSKSVPPSQSTCNSPSVSFLPSSLSPLAELELTRSTRHKPTHPHSAARSPHTRNTSPPRLLGETAYTLMRSLVCL